MSLTDFLYLTTIVVLVVIGYSHFSLALYIKRHSGNGGEATRPTPVVSKTRPNGKPGVIVRTEAQEAEIEERMMAKKGWDGPFTA